LHVRVLQHHSNTIVADARFCTRRWRGGRFVDNFFCNRFLRGIRLFSISSAAYIGTRNRCAKNRSNVVVRAHDSISLRKSPSEVKSHTPTLCFSRASFLKTEVRCQVGKCECRRLGFLVGQKRSPIRRTFRRPANALTSG
jgi:hypothetical protein